MAKSPAFANMPSIVKAQRETTEQLRAMNQLLRLVLGELGTTREALGAAAPSTSSNPAWTAAAPMPGAKQVPCETCGMPVQVPRSANRAWCQQHLDHMKT
jgi:hypothetical protein